MSICTKNGYISWSITSYLIVGCGPFLVNFGGTTVWRRGGKYSYTQKQRFSRVRAYVTSTLQLNLNWKLARITIIIVCVFDCIFSDINTHTYKIHTKLVKSSVFPYIVISIHLYLRGHIDSRAENSHEEHKHICVHVHEFSEAFIANHRRYMYTSEGVLKTILVLLWK